MRTEQAVPVRLADYRPPDWLVETVDLDVALDPTRTRVRAKLKLAPNPDAAAPAPVVLDGDELVLRAVAIDGAPLAADAYVATADGLTILQPPNRPFVLDIETELDPTANTKLMGLYRSGKAYTTQCEAEGFRRITYFPDRPDVMAVFTTRIEADKAEAPVLLANGNLVDSGDLPDGRHFAVWHDPFPKPSYLFALVGGVLGVVEDTFTTMSGRKVALKIYVEPGKESRADYAMGALKRSMRWDEEAFGREYDLDIFMIVAVSYFNMGAMENKGLNIFNDKNVLASPATATDMDFNSVEAIIAHEYFHNWTGNRITCRDWFQLCLKEGLTVFRDQEFSSDVRSRAVKRIARRAGAARPPVRRGRRPPRPSGAARGLSRDQQFLHLDHLREGRRGRADDQDAARPGEIPRRHGPLFQAPRRPRCDRRRVRRLLRRRFGPRLRPVHALVQPGRHAGGRGAGEPRCERRYLHPRDHANGAADAGAAGEGADGDPVGDRLPRARRPRSPGDARRRRNSFARRRHAHQADRDLRLRRSTRATGALPQPRLLGPGQADRQSARRRPRLPRRA